MVRRGASVAIVGVLMVGALLVPVATATPAGAAAAATVGHCYFSPHNTQVHWDQDVIERKYGIHAHVSHVTFWWYIPSRGGSVNGNGTIDGYHARAATLEGAQSVRATIAISSSGSTVGSFSTTPDTSCTSG